MYPIRTVLHEDVLIIIVFEPVIKVYYIFVGKGLMNFDFVNELILDELFTFYFCNIYSFFLGITLATYVESESTFLTR